MALRIRMSKKTKIILIAIFALILAGTGGYLLWRVNQDDTVAPTDSDAADCPDGCYFHGGAQRCVGNGGGCWWVCKKTDGTTHNVYSGLCHSGETNLGLDCTSCDSGGSCPSIPNQGSVGDVGSSCDSSNCGGDCGVYTFKCGTLCYQSGCGADACTYTPPAPTTYTIRYIAGTGGSISGNTTQTVEEGGSGTEVEAIPDTGYLFSYWSDDPIAIDGWTGELRYGSKRIHTNVQRDITVTARFNLESFSLTYNAGDNGSITGSTFQRVNYGGDGTTVTAVPDTNYRFASWSDGVTTAERTDTNVVASKNVTANFTIIGTYSLTYTADENGSISGDTSQSVNHGGSGTEVEAIPDTGYYFSKWSDGLTTAKRTDTNVQEDIAVIATFSTDCGNGICEEDEDENSCPADCKTTVVVEEVPQTGIFDENTKLLSLGLVFIVLGLTWTTIQNTMKTTISKAISGYIRVNNQRNIQKTENIRKKFENKVVKK